jgi:hemoglobin/transferrin/lactoferrin receptor protein
VGAELRDVSFSSIDTRYLGSSDTVVLVEVDPDFVPETKTRNINVYLRDEIDLANQPWRFRVGGRFDNYRYSPSFNAQYQDPSNTVGDLSFSAFTWQSGVDFKVTAVQTLSLQVGTGFRAPSVENLYFATLTSPGTDPVSGAPVVLWDSVANPNLTNEQSLNTELAYAWKTQRHSLTLAVFRDRYSDFIETQTLYRQVGSINDDYTTTVNTGEVIVKGAEISSRWILGNHFAIGFAYSVNEGEKKNGDPLLSIVPASGVLGLEYQALENRLAASINVTHAATKDRKDTLQTDSSGAQTPGTSFVTDSFTVVDLQSRYQITKGLKITAGIYNVLDKQYWRWSRVRFVSEGTGGARGGVSDNGLNRYAEPGRNFKATVSYAF